MSRSLLQEIQDAAVDSASDLASVLRKCKVLAARLNSKPLENWLVWEANGYPEQVTVPPYRRWPLQLKGHFAGSFGSGMRNAPVPLICLPERVRAQYENYECRQSVAALEGLSKRDEGTLTLDTGDLNVVLGMKVYRGMNCIQVWAEMGTGNLVEAMNAVRNRILDFSLALWKEDPGAGQLGNGAHISTEEIAKIFHSTIYDGREGSR